MKAFHRWVQLLALLASLGLSAWAQEDRPIKTFFVDTSPSGANVTDQFHSFLGRSGGNIPFDLSHYSKGGMTLNFELDGYVPESRDFYVAQLKDRSDFTPLQDRPIDFRPTSATLAKRWAPACLTALVLATGLAINARSRGQEARRRDKLLSEVGQGDSLATMVLGRYRLLRKLGQGGMASVYLAVPAATMRPEEGVALKVLSPAAFQDNEFMARFRREAAITGSLDHPNVVRLLDWGEDKGYAYLVMELIEGGNLRERPDGSPWPCAEVWTALEPVCSAVAYAHERHIVHRDLKPENLMITRAGVIKVSDFGLARSEDGDKVTVTGTALGTPAYMSPEQIQGFDPQAAMDQYAIGVVAYELLTGRTPFTSADPVQQIFKALSEVPRPPSSLVDLPPRVDAVVLKMLEKDPAARYGSLAEAARTLQSALAG